MRKRRLAAFMLAAVMTAGSGLTAFAATAQDVINMNSASYTAGTSSVYGPSLTQDQLNQVAQAVANFTTTYINDSMDNDAKIRTAYDYLVNTVSYIDWDQGEGANTAFGALVRGQAACSGYARAFKALCDAMGVSCYYIHSTGNDHQWNMVEFNDGYYFVDVQANDSSGFDWIYHADAHPYAYDTSAFPAVGSRSGQDTSGTAETAAGEGWKQDSTGWWWRNADGSYPANQWKEVDGKYYYFGADGYMLANTTTPDGYQVDASGAWVQGGAQETQQVQTNYITDSNTLTDFQGTGWVNDNGQMAYKKPDGQYYRMEWARIDGKDYYFGIDGYMEWELEPLSARVRTEQDIDPELNFVRKRGVQPGDQWQSDTHGVWYKKPDGSIANFFLWQSNVLAGDTDYGFSGDYLRLEGENQKNLFFMRDMKACFGEVVGERLQEMESLQYANQEGITVFSISPSGTVYLNHRDGTFSIGGSGFIPQLYWDAVDNGEIPPEYQYGVRY